MQESKSCALPLGDATLSERRPCPKAGASRSYGLTLFLLLAAYALTAPVRLFLTRASFETGENFDQIYLSLLFHFSLAATVAEATSVTLLADQRSVGRILTLFSLPAIWMRICPSEKQRGLFDQKTHHCSTVSEICLFSVTVIWRLSSKTAALREAYLQSSSSALRSLSPV